MNDKKSSKGRKPIEDKKVPLRVYIPESHIFKLGGYIPAQLAVVDFITRKVRKYK
jgi:hypothetical protein